MKPRNLISVYQGAAAIDKPELAAEKKFKALKTHEIRNLHSLCDIMSAYGCTFANFDGFFVGYSIGQIGKEFDLLRFGDDQIINIEVKSELKVAKKEEKILKQMQVNYYYLKFLGRPIRIFSFVENDGFYEFLIESNTVIKVDAQTLVACVKNHVVNYNIDPDKEFIPSNYLISPFNSTDKFLKGEYFLTTAQQKIKDEIQAELLINPFMYFSISANAGTGKTLLMYDIAKGVFQSKQKALIIHCGKLNAGHAKLNLDHGWMIRSIRNVNAVSVENLLAGCSILFIDEAQRIRPYQLQLIIEASQVKRIPIIFSYDTKQYLRRDEGHDIEEYLRRCHPDITLSTKRLTTKIRTNKELASFITNLLSIGSSKDHLDYSCVTIEYMNTLEELKEYVAFLEGDGWVPLTYTTSLRDKDPYDTLSEICDKNAHDVIGQEFSKVVFAMDENFEYSEANKLTARNGYYSARGMLYQIVTRVVDELKIVVLNNPKLYLKLLEIKSMGD